ncbi:MAG: hypothetical protein MJ183_09100 [Treponemataceae bacterium]|nr:hypothetical protein [Treponemataceae bacterium]
MQTQVVPPQETSSKKAVLAFAKNALMQDDMLFDIQLPFDAIDAQTVNALSQIYVSATISFPLLDGRNPQTAATKKFIAKKCALLNDAGLVFGISIDFGSSASGESAGSSVPPSEQPLTLRTARDTLDFAVEQYPNHLELVTDGIRPSGVFSTQDIGTLQNLSVAADLFYTRGRAVPWFLTVIKPLRLKPSVFFHDFSEWLSCNNCNASSGFDPAQETHESIEKMQLAFLRIKYEEKNRYQLLPAVTDLVSLHGAFSRADCEESETLLDLSYNAMDLFSPSVLDLHMFFDQTLMEANTVKVFPTEEGADYMQV